MKKTCRFIAGIVVWGCLTSCGWLAKSHINSWIEVGPDSLLNHFPNTELLLQGDAIYSTIAPEDKREIGGGYVEIFIDQNDSLDRFMKTLDSGQRLNRIKKDQIFNVNLNYPDRKYELSNFTENSQFPFPEFINIKNFDDYKLVFYDYGVGQFANEKLIKENQHIDPKWRHGFTRGIVEYSENEYEMWLIIW